MPNVFWSSDADAYLVGLPDTIKREVRRRAAYVRRYPEMYPLVQQGRHRGERRFTVARRYHVYYKIYGDASGCFVTEMSPARAEPE